MELPSITRPILKPAFLFLALGVLPLLYRDAAGNDPVSNSGPVQNPVCGCCGNAILKDYMRIPGLEEYFCLECFSSRPHCFFCGQPFRERGKPSKMDRPVCPLCAKTAVRNIQDARNHYQWIKRRVEKLLGNPFPDSITMKLAENLGREAGIPLSGETRELGAFVKQGSEHTLLILANMPECLFIETVAHELTHVWQDLFCVRGQDIQIREGFAQWVADRILAHTDCSREIKILRNREDIYGTGYRRLKKIEEEKGLAYLLQYVRTNLGDKS